MSASGEGPHVLLADSGLGGLAVCAALERSLRAFSDCSLRLTYFNAAPDAQQGYNDQPDTPARAALLDRALSAMEALQPDRIVLACNTLSVLYEHTAHARRGAGRATGIVTGILEAGLRLFAGALSADPEWGAAPAGDPHHDRFGNTPETPAGPGTGARAHRRDFLPRAGQGHRSRPIRPGGPAAPRGVRGGPAGTGPARGAPVRRPGLHALRIRRSGHRRGAAGSGRPARAHPESQRGPGGGGGGGDPDGRDPRRPATARATATAAGGPEITVRVLSKVALGESSRRAIAGRLDPVSALTARALLSYTCDPDLF